MMWKLKNYRVRTITYQT